jgi:predicted DNA-binding antitoxin AbrB/MazE fold protein
MMPRKVTAIVRNGGFAPLEPLNLPEGRQVELDVTVVPTPEEQTEKMERLLRNLGRLQEEAAQYPEEWWDDFQKELETNRFTIPVCAAGFVDRELGSTMMTLCRAEAADDA